MCEFKYLNIYHSFPFDYKSTSCKVIWVVWQLFRGLPPRQASLFKLPSSLRLTSRGFLHTHNKVKANTWTNFRLMVNIIVRL